MTIEALAVPGWVFVLALLLAAGAALRRRRRTGLPPEITNALKNRAPTPRRGRPGAYDGDIAFIVFFAALLIGLVAGDRIL